VDIFARLVRRLRDSLHAVLAFIAHMARHQMIDHALLDSHVLLVLTR
jgi:hypothetical protein